MTKQHYMTDTERAKLEAYYEMKMPVAEIAQRLGFCRQTIYNELHAGFYGHNVEYAYVTRYSAQKAKDVHRKRQTAKGRPLKIGHDHAYANYLEHMIVEERYSPAAALAAARRKGFTTSISVGTLYSYIDKRVFLKLTNKHLWEKSKKKQKKEEEQRIAHPKLPSIEDRPDYINSREEYGHQEMDLVVSAKGSNAVLLTFTERISHQETIIKLPNRKADTICRAIDELERKLPDFRERFQTITTDNGSEFLKYENLRQSINGGQRFEVYYCHSYAAWEKGSNENHNRMIRRWFPKGTDFTKVSVRKIRRVQDWMNHYPRKSLGWLSPAEIA